MTIEFWPATLALFAAGMVGVVALVLTLPRVIADKIPIANPVLKRLVLAAQPTVLLLIAAAVGSAVANRIGATSSIAESASGLAGSEGGFSPRTLVLALLGGAVLGGALYGVDRRTRWWWAGPDDRDLIDDWKAGTLIGGILYGGIAEEVLMRWGVMSLVLWLLAVVTGAAAPIGWPLVAVAVILSSLLFAVGHLPAAMVERKRSRRFIARIIGLNTVAGLVFGWLFWSVSLEAAMAAHAGFHIGAALLSVVAGRLQAS